MLILKNLYERLHWYFLQGRKCSNTAWLSHSYIIFLWLWIDICIDCYTSVNTKILPTHSKFLNNLGQAQLSDMEIACAIHSLDHNNELSESLSWNGAFASLADLSNFFMPWFCLLNCAGGNLQSSNLLGQLPQSLKIIWNQRIF